MWDFIDKTYVLSLETAKDKQSIISAHLQDLKIPFELVTFPAIQANVENSCQAIECSIWDLMCLNVTDDVSNDIAKNHLILVAKAFKENWKTVMILEDDALFDRPMDLFKLQRIAEWIRFHPFDVFYFGYCPWPIPVTFMETPDVVRIVSPYASHAYVLSRTGMEKIMRHLMDNHLDASHLNMHYDKFLATIPGLQKFGIFPMINFQSADPALYRRCFQKMFHGHLYVSFRWMIRSLEMVAVALPIISVFVMCHLIFRLFARFRTDHISDTHTAQN